MPDYSNLARVQNGIPTRTPVPELFINSQIPLDQMIELTWVGLDEYIGVGWWPIENHWPVLGLYQSYDGDEVLTIDTARTVVVSTRTVRDWSAQEIHDWKVSTTRHITRLAFRKRFTLAERIAIEMAQIDDPSASQQAREAAARLRVMEKDLDASPPPYVDLNSAFVQDAVLERESLGLIAAGRADEIIWADIEQNEVP